MKKRVAVIGAGLSGLLVARALAEVAVVTVFEKARGVGGRSATRLADPYAFDHGAQCFTARTPAFKAYLEPLLAAGVVAPWRGPVVNLNYSGTTPRQWEEEHLVAAPRMNSWCHWLAEGLDIRFNTEVAPPLRAGVWQLAAKDDGRALGEFDWLIITAPPEQARVLLGAAKLVQPILDEVYMQPCHALILGLPGPCPLPWIAARVTEGPLKWISVDSSKPGRRADVTCLVAHSQNEWAEANLDADPAMVEQTLVAEVAKLTGLEVAEAGYCKLHRWKYAIVGHGKKSGPLIMAQHGYAVTSDWAYSSRLEEVWQAASEVGLLIGEQLRS